MKPSRRKVARFDLQARLGQTGEIQRRTEEAAAESFNDAVGKYRRGAPPAEVRLALVQVAAALVLTLDEWLQTEQSGEILVSGHLEGGKLESKFVLYRCTGKPPKTGWKPSDEWSLEVDDESDEAITDLRLPLGRERYVEQLVEKLELFVRGVDVAEGRRVPPRD